MITEEPDASGGSGERQRLVNAHHQASRDFDRTVMTLAAGALGLSIAFMKDIAGPDANALPALGAAWFLFAATLMVILVSFLTSQAGLLYQIEVIDGRKPEVAPGGTYGRWTLRLNAAAAVALVAGVLSLVLFAINNV